MRSFDTMLANRKGIMPGIAQVWLLPVLAIVVAQADALRGNDLAGLPLLWSLPSLCVGAVAFCLGLTAAAARERAIGARFVTEQMRATVPTYAFAVLVVLLVLGPLLTDEPRRRYAADPETATYLLNLVAWPRFTLPGMFEFNDVPDIVNRGVWIAPVFVVLVAALMIPRRGLFRLTLPALAAALAAGAILAQALGVDPNAPTDMLYLVLRGDAMSALLGALLGAAAYRHRRRVPFAPRIATLAALVIAAVALVGNAGWADTAVYRVFVAVPIGYLALYGAMRPLPFRRLARPLSRYLLGFYLLSYPAVQTALQLHRFQNTVGNIAIGLVAAALLAVAFRHAIAIRLMSRSQRVAVEATDEALAGQYASRSRGRFNRGQMVGYGAVVLVLVALSIGVAAMIYLAMQPETGAI